MAPLVVVAPMSSLPGFAHLLQLSLDYLCPELLQSSGVSTVPLASHSRLHTLFY